MEHAEARGATILAEIVGYGNTCDAYHMTSPHPEGLGAIKAMKLAISEAGLEPADIDYINAHGTSTPANEKGKPSYCIRIQQEHASFFHQVLHRGGALVGGGRCS